VPRPSANAGHQAQLSAALRAAEKGQRKPVYLLVGEPFETQAAARALIDVLVPEAQRVFNLEVLDGRTTPMPGVVDSLRTPGFFSGVKVVWVRECTAFLSGEKRGDLTRSLLAAWTDGRQQDAIEKLLVLVALAGWSQDQFSEARFPALAKTKISAVFGQDLEADERVQVEAVQAAALARDLRVAAYGDDSAVLLEFLASPAAADSVAILTSAGVDARRRAVKQLRDIGVLIEFDTARERSGALARETVDEVVQRVLRDFGKKLAPRARSLVAQRAGRELSTLASEMEKLCLYVGERDTIAEEDVGLVFRDMAESWIFDFTSALATRRLPQALPLLRGLLKQGEAPLRLLAMIAREVRMLLLARECLDDTLRGRWRRDTSFPAFQKQILPLLDDDTRRAFGNAHPFVLYRRLQDATGIDAETLRDALIELSDLDLRLKSSRSDSGMLLEAFVVAWCARAPAASANAAVR
jgi:DNA polymerase-3 subunit delta